MNKIQSENEAFVKEKNIFEWTFSGDFGQVDRCPSIYLTRDDFKTIARGLNKFQNNNQPLLLDQQIHLIWLLFDTDIYFFQYMHCIVDDESYLLGFEVDNSVHAEHVGSFLINKNKHRAIADLKHDFWTRYEKLQDEDEKSNLIKNETRFLTELIEKGKLSDDAVDLGFYEGFTSESRGLSSYVFAKPFTQSSYHQTLVGVASYHLLNQFQYLNDNKGNESEEVISLESNGPRHRLILLYELGLLEKLRTDYSYLDKVKLAQIIGLITGLTTREDIKQIQKEIDPVISNLATSGKGGKPINTKSAKAIIEALRKIGAKIKSKHLMLYDQ